MNNQVSFLVPVLLACVALFTSPMTARAAEPCHQIHGRAVMYNGDGQMRIWHIGTHHTFEPDGDPSWEKLGHFMRDDQDGGMLTKVLFADFVLCPTAPLVKGATQPATVKQIKRPIVLTWEQWAELQKRGN